MSFTNSYKQTSLDMSSGFIHKHKLLQKPTDNCKTGISWEKKKTPNETGKIIMSVIFLQHFKSRNSILLLHTKR